MTQEAIEVVDNEVTDIESAESPQVEASQEDAPQEEVKETKEETIEDEKGDDFVPFPKKAKNAISYRDKKIAKLTAEVNELRKLHEAGQSQPKVNEAPNENDFESYSDFLEAKILHKIAQEKGQPEEQAATNEIDMQRQQYIAQRVQDIAVKSQEYAKSIPGYQQVLYENLELIDYLPAEIRDVFLEADDTALAFYNLAKSGDIYSLAEMTPYRAAMVIAQAQSMPAQKPAAPVHKPITGAKGVGKAGKSISEMTPDEIAKKYNL